MSECRDLIGMSKGAAAECLENADYLCVHAQEVSCRHLMFSEKNTAKVSMAELQPFLVMLQKGVLQNK